MKASRVTKVHLSPRAELPLARSRARCGTWAAVAQTRTLDAGLGEVTCRGCLRLAGALAPAPPVEPSLMLQPWGLVRYMDWLLSDFVGVVPPEMTPERWASMCRTADDGLRCGKCWACRWEDESASMRGERHIDTARLRQVKPERAYPFPNVRAAMLVAVREPDRGVRWSQGAALERLRDGVGFGGDGTNNAELRLGDVVVLNRLRATLSDAEWHEATRLPEGIVHAIVVTWTLGGQRRTTRSTERVEFDEVAAARALGVEPSIADGVMRRVRRNVGRELAARGMIPPPSADGRADVVIRRDEIAREQQAARTRGRAT